MKNKKRPRLPRGLRWRSESQYIWFTWRDAGGIQRQKSTETTDPAKALLFKMHFLTRQQENREECEPEGADLGKLPLSRVSDLYFEWKAASNSALTIARERRILNRVLEYFGRRIPVRSIKLHKIRKYQKERRKEISPTMKQPVTARTVNYEMQLLRSVMTYADCWSDDLETRYKPLRQVKSRAGKVASNDQLMKMITTAMGNDFWQLAMYCGAFATGSGCRGGEIRNLQLKDVCLSEGKVRVVREIAKNRKEREPRLMALAEWGLLPLNIRKSRHLAKQTKEKWEVNRPMTSWVKSWRKLMAACGMTGFRFHDLRHTFRTQGAQAGVPLEVMMAQLGHMDRETSIDYVHVQQRALERAKQLIESEQTEVLAAAERAVASLSCDGGTLKQLSSGASDTVNHR